MITLKKIDRDNYRECTNLSVAEEQSRFVAPNAKSLSKAYAFYESAHPFAVYADNVMVGFILYRDVAESGNYVIDQVMIDKRYQRMGYGREVMRETLKLLRKAGRFDRACVCCCLNNEIALKFFRSFGFDKVEGEEAGEIVLCADLTPSGL